MTISVEIEDVDIKTGISLNGGTIENYIKTVEIFYRDGFEKINLLRDCLNKNNLILYTTFVHGLKSALANIGAKKLSDFAKGLESAGKNNSFDFIFKNNENFIIELEKLLKYLGIIIAENTKEKSELDNQDIIFLKNSLSELKTALDNMDAEKINNLLKELESKIWDKTNRENINKISQLVLISDYDEAIELINNIL